jgi:hypothetical protein
MILEDGTGDGYKASVTSENQVRTESVTSNESNHANHDHGWAYTISFSATPTGAGDCFLYVKNTADEDMIINGGGLYCEADEYFDIKLGDGGTASGGSTIIPVNLNAGSGNTADGTFLSGNDITGLSGGSVVYRIYHATSKETTNSTFPQSIVLPKNSVLTFYAQTGTTALAGFLNVYYHD